MSKPSNRLLKSVTVSKKLQDGKAINIDISLDHLLHHCLCPAGDGVFTVHTARDKKQAVQQLLYGENSADILEQWHRQLASIATQIRPLILGIASDTGGGICRGANWGPLFIREKLYQRLTPDHLCDIGDVRVIPHLLHDKYLNKETLQTCQKALYGEDCDETYPVSPLSISEFVLRNIYRLAGSSRILALGGDHSISYATVLPYLKFKKQKGIRAAVIHFDAHTDLSESRLGIDINFSTWAYAALPHLTNPSDLIQIGLRASGHPKSYWTQKYGVQQFWAEEILTSGIEPVMSDITSYLQREKVQELYISFDIDVLDQRVASATGTPEPNGLTTEDCVKLIEHLGHTFMVTGADLVEVAPFIHQPSPFSPTEEAIVCLEPDSTLEAAAEICQALLHAL